VDRIWGQVARTARSQLHESATDAPISVIVAGPLECPAVTWDNPRDACQLSESTAIRRQFQGILKLGEF